jgi:hypothetical protein
MKCVVCGHCLAFRLNRSFEVLKLTVVGILMGCGLDDLDFDSRPEQDLFRTQNARSESIFESVLK